MIKKAGVEIKLTVFTALLGAFAGLLIWCFLKAASAGSSFFWEGAPSLTGTPYITVILCTAAGLFAGILRKKYGDYPEELRVVMGKIKKDHYYPYHPMPVMLLCAMIPLVAGSSVGPEAGLTGIIAALCYWVGDNITGAKENSEILLEVGEAVTLGQLFRSPLFGIIAVEESDTDIDGKPPKMSRSSRLVFYVLSSAAGFFVIEFMNRVFGAALGGFPAFSEAPVSRSDYIALLIYIPAGLLVFLIYELCEKGTAAISGFIPPVLKEGICGLLIGLTGLFFPMVIFSGEEQMAELMDTFTGYAPLMLLGISLFKLLMTAFCLNFGLKGGHFFPLIFACTTMGFFITACVFNGAPEHAAFAAAAVTATVLGAQLKKPLAASLLLLLCFPLKLLPWIFLCAVLGKAAGQLIPHEKGNDEP